MIKSLLPYMARFSNEDFKISFEFVCSDLEEKEFTVDDNIQQSFEKAVAYIHQLEILRSDSNGPHHLTKFIQEKRDLRHDYLSSARGRVTYFLKSPVSDERDAAQVLDAWLNRFSKNLNKRSIIKQSEMVQNLIKDLNASQAINQALETLGLSDTFLQIQLITVLLLEDHATRKKERLEKNLKSKEVRSVAYDRMKTLWTTIETAIKLEKGDANELMEYLRIINSNISDIKTLHLNSKTRLKTAAEKAAEEEKENALPESGAQSNSTQSAGMQNRNAFSYVRKNEIEEHDNLASQEAAMQSKTIEGGAVSTIPVNGDQEHDTAEIPKMPIAKHNASTNGSDRES